MTTTAAALCPDCGVEPGVIHDRGCDVARCLESGLQRLCCREKHDCGEDVWTGRWPGQAECEEFGWWAYFVPNGDPSWVSCGPDRPGAVHHLSRLILEARWDRETARWIHP